MWPFKLYEFFEDIIKKFAAAKARKPCL